MDSLQQQEEQQEQQQTQSQNNDEKSKEEKLVDTISKVVKISTSDIIVDAGGGGKGVVEGRSTVNNVVENSNEKLIEEKSADSTNKTAEIETNCEVNIINKCESDVNNIIVEKKRDLNVESCLTECSLDKVVLTKKVDEIINNKSQDSNAVEQLNLCDFKGGGGVLTDLTDKNTIIADKLIKDIQVPKIDNIEKISTNNDEIHSKIDSTCSNSSSSSSNSNCSNSKVINEIQNVNSIGDHKRPDLGDNDKTRNFYNNSIPDDYSIRNDNKANYQISYNINQKVPEFTQRQEVPVRDERLIHHQNYNNSSIDLRTPTSSNDDYNRANNLLYVNKPDFSKQIQSQKISHSLSQLQMKPPDFTKLNHSELQISNPDFTKNYAAEQQQQQTKSHVTPSNFAEYSRKNNFISDLRLKTPTQNSNNTNLYVKAPDFNSTTTTKIDQVLPNDYSNEEPTPHVIHKNQFLTQNFKPASESKPNTYTAQSIIDEQVKAQYNDRKSAEDVYRRHPNYPYYERVSKDAPKTVRQPELPYHYSQYQQRTELPEKYKSSSVPVTSAQVPYNHYNSTTSSRSIQHNPYYPQNPVIQNNKSIAENGSVAIRNTQQQPPQQQYYYNQDQQNYLSQMYSNSASPILRNKNSPVSSPITAASITRPIKSPVPQHKSQTSPGLMNPPNPPQNWSRVSQSPISNSPHNIQAQSPTFLHPSPRPSPSPTNIINNKSAIPSPVSYKTTPSPTFNSKYSTTTTTTEVSSNSRENFKKQEVLAQRYNAEQYYSQSKSVLPPSLPPQQQLHHQTQQQQPGYDGRVKYEYPPTNSIPTKNGPTKPVEFVDLTKTTTKPDDKYNYKYASSGELNNQQSSIRDQKFLIGYNQMKSQNINQQYSMRHATSEADLNMYNRVNYRPDVTMRLSDNDLQRKHAEENYKNSFKQKTNYSSLSSENLHQKNPYEVPPQSKQEKYPSNYAAYPSVKYPPTPVEIQKQRMDLNYKQQQPPLQQQQQPHPSISYRRPSYPSEHNKLNDRMRPSETVTSVSYKSLPSTSQNPATEFHSNAVITKIKNEQPIYNPSVPVIRPIENPVELTKKTVVPGVKKESPLDLSVKTIKTKADSTGCDDPNVTGSGPSHKVDFLPNFSKHSPVDYRALNYNNIPQQNYHQPYQQQQPPPQQRVYQNPPQPIPQPQPQTSQRIEDKRNLNYKPVDDPSHPKFDPYGRPYSQPVKTDQVNYPNNYYGKHLPNNNLRAPPPPPQTDQLYKKPKLDPIPMPVKSGYPHINSHPEDKRISKPPTISEKLYYERLEDRKYVERLLKRNGPDDQRYSLYNPPIPTIPATNRKRPIESYPSEVPVPIKQHRVEPQQKSVTEIYQNHLNMQKNDPSKGIFPPASIHRVPKDPKIVYPHDGRIPQYYNPQLPIGTREPEKHTKPAEQNFIQHQTDVQRYSEVKKENIPYMPPYNPDPKIQTVKNTTEIRIPYPTTQQPTIPPIQNDRPYYPYPTKRDNYYPAQPSHPTWFPPQMEEHRKSMENIPQNVYQNPNYPYFKPDNYIRPQNYQEVPQIRPEDVTKQSQPINNIIPPKGADQNVISKLRNNLEMKEMEKQKLLLRKQNSQEMSEDENNKSDINSILAARIRTKGELKGFNPIPPQSVEIVKPPAEIEQQPIELPKRIEPPSDIEGASGFDLMDWGSACNDFVEQLQTGKKRGRRKPNNKAAASTSSTSVQVKKWNLDIKMETVQKETTLSDLKVPENNQLIDNQVEIIKAENQDFKPTVEVVEEEEQVKKSMTSSDEDKPLLLLRQQSVTGKTEDESIKIKSELNRNAVVEKLAEKLERNLKEKQRMEHEKRLAARLDATSSDSENDSNKTPRPRKRSKKLKSRSSLSKKNSSDNNSVEGVELEVITPKKDETIEVNNKRKVKSSSDSEPLSMRRKSVRRNTIVSGNEDKTQNSGISGDDKKSIKIIQTRSRSKDVKKDDSSSDDDADADDDVEDDNKKITEKKDSSSSDSESEKNKLKKMIDSKTKSPKTIARTIGTRRSVVEEDKTKTMETMTRSKRKREIERLSNSKVLRNDKIIHCGQAAKKVIVDVKKDVKGKVNKIDEKSIKNCLQKKCDKKDENKKKIEETDSDDLKSLKGKKIIKKLVKMESSSNELSESEPEAVTERLRPRKSKSINESPPDESKKIKEEKDKIKEKSKPLEKSAEKKAGKGAGSKKGNASKIPQPDETINKYPPGWEEDLYQYKKSLKVPQKLISVTPWQRISTSLPDLDPHSSDASESFAEINKKDGNKIIEIKTEVTVIKEEVASKSQSIIDLLHQRINRPIKPIKKNRLSNCPLKLVESKLAAAAVVKTVEPELIPTPGVDSEVILGNVQTAVMMSRTRTEYRVMKTKEIFVGDDRPASAPPLGIVIKSENDSEAEVITYDQKISQYIQKMNVDFGERSKVITKPDQIVIKTERIDDLDDETQDTEINSIDRIFEIKEETLDEKDRDTPSVISERDEMTPISFRGSFKGKKPRSGRRKGSSGFDYIRKKKKPVHPSNSENSVPVVHKRRSAAVNYLQQKDENDISREIKGWVLNKGVGESVLHKASRLGYIDIIAFCLIRLEMHPDQKDNAGYTPLHEACSRGHIDIARLLLLYGANHSETAHSGIRPLHEATENGYIEIVRLLLAYGADPLLATYSGHTPLMLAETDEMTMFLKNHLFDIQNTSPNKMAWKFDGAWKSFETDSEGYDIFENCPENYIEEDDPNLKSLRTSSENTPIKQENSEELTTPIKSSIDETTVTERCDSNSNIMNFEMKATSFNNKVTKRIEEKINLSSKFKNVSTNCTVVLNNIDSMTNFNCTSAAIKTYDSIDYSNKLLPRQQSLQDKENFDLVTSDSDGDVFEIEESESPLPPLYLLRDEGSEKWVLLSDLCTLLKVKSKDTLLKQICPNSPLSSAVNKELLRELKMGDFLERATCLQLLCAGEKINIRASKVILVKYNESVRNLLGVQTAVMRL